MPTRWKGLLAFFWKSFSPPIPTTSPPTSLHLATSHPPPISVIPPYEKTAPSVFCPPLCVCIHPLLHFILLSLFSLFLSFPLYPRSLFLSISLRQFLLLSLSLSLTLSLAVFSMLSSSVWLFLLSPSFRPPPPPPPSAFFFFLSISLPLSSFSVPLFHTHNTYTHTLTHSVILSKNEENRQVFIHMYSFIYQAHLMLVQDIEML